MPRIYLVDKKHATGNHRHLFKLPNDPPKQLTRIVEFRGGVSQDLDANVAEYLCKEEGIAVKDPSMLAQAIEISATTPWAGLLEERAEERATEPAVEPKPAVAGGKKGE